MIPKLIPRLNLLPMSAIPRLKPPQFYGLYYSNGTSIIALNSLMIDMECRPILKLSPNH
jgi:hypothetical protein